ncbi:MAG: hypothetical protein F4029_13535 [Gammaproteobacteria bacterium]|nr:hypothetical protein [Gammaproteobacteria bacterium]MYK47239.1 hypothetical protein [Gammaproteobacteria bacterium]
MHRLIGTFRVRHRASDIDADALLDAMGMDKKVMDGRLRLILRDGIGSVSVATVVRSRSSGEQSRTDVRRRRNQIATRPSLHGIATL